MVVAFAGPPPVEDPHHVEELERADHRQEHPDADGRPEQRDRDRGAAPATSVAPSIWAASYELVRDALQPGQEEDDGEAEVLPGEHDEHRVQRATSGCPARPARRPQADRTEHRSIRPYRAAAAGSHTTPAMTSESTYGTKMIVRKQPGPATCRLSSSAIASAERQLHQDRRTTMIMLCRNASGRPRWSAPRRSSRSPTKSTSGPKPFQLYRRDTHGAEPIGQTTKTPNSDQCRTDEEEDLEPISRRGPAPAPAAPPGRRPCGSTTGGHRRWPVPRMARSRGGHRGRHFSARPPAASSPRCPAGSPCRRRSVRSRRSSRRRRTARRRCRSTAGRTGASSRTLSSPAQGGVG